MAEWKAYDKYFPSRNRILAEAGKKGTTHQKRGLTLTHPNAVASLTAAVLAGICAGYTFRDLAQVSIVEINVSISIGQMFDSLQGPVLFLARIGSRGTLRDKQAHFLNHDVVSS